MLGRAGAEWAVAVLVEGLEEQVLGLRAGGEKTIVVPPEKRIMNVGVQPSKEAYKPGEKAKVDIKLTDMAGHAFVGSTVVAIYDKSVEYISGGSNVPDIKEFFWKWRRQHYPRTESSLERWFWNLVPPKTVGMIEASPGTFALFSKATTSFSLRLSL